MGQTLRVTKHFSSLSGSPLLQRRKETPFHLSWSFCIHHFAGSTTNFLEATSSSGCLEVLQALGACVPETHNSPGVGRKSRKKYLIKNKMKTTM